MESSRREDILKKSRRNNSGNDRDFNPKTDFSKVDPVFIDQRYLHSSSFSTG
jgi:hypothetical protein